MGFSIFRCEITKIRLVLHMKFGPNYKPEFESIRDLILDIAQERSIDVLLQMVVRRMAEERPHVKLARLWLIQKGDICPSCRMRNECRDQTRCLHLVASSGLLETNYGPEKALFEGNLKRIPVGFGRIGRIAQTGSQERIIDTTKERGQLAQREWLEKEGISGIGGQPLIHKGEVLSVIVLFTQIPLFKEGAIWLRIVANHAASAIANARAFEEIEHLKRQLELENAYLKEELNEYHSFGDIIGQSPPLKIILKQVELVAPTDTSVLILGETGTGKELIAREIHRHSLRKDRAMIKVNCATIPRDLYESEFFGHIRGAFTGAVKDRSGRFQAADGGTLFLDEVGEIPLEVQGKFLRVLQEGEYERIGEEKTRQVDVRIIAATNRDLQKDVNEKRFREDLYYRLNVFPIEIAPLRHRKQDIPLLASHFLRLSAVKLNRPLKHLSKTNFSKLQEYNWPGNIRELINVIERAVINSRAGNLYFDIPLHGDPVMTMREGHDSFELKDKSDILSDLEIKQKERDNILKALNQSGGKIYGRGGAAELLGVKPTTLSYRIKKMKLKAYRD